MMDSRSLLLFSRALLRDKQVRRRIMFHSSIVTMVLVFSGAFLLSSVLQESLPLFVGYWALCFGCALFMLLMALYDLLAVRAQHQSEMRALRQRMQDSIKKDTHTGQR